MTKTHNDVGAFYKYPLYLNDYNVTIYSKFLYMTMLGTRIPNTDLCHTTIHQLSKKTNIAKSTCYRAMAELLEVGLIKEVEVDGNSYYKVIRK